MSSGGGGGQGEHMSSAYDLSLLHASSGNSSFMNTGVSSSTPTKLAPQTGDHWMGMISC